MGNFGRFLFPVERSRRKTAATSHGRLIENGEIPRKMRRVYVRPEFYGRRDHFPAAWLYFAEQSRGVSLTYVCIHVPRNFAKARHVNLVLIRARDSERIGSVAIREQKIEKEKKERRVPAGTRDESFSFSCCVVVSSCPKVFQSRLDCAVISLCLLSRLFVSCVFLFCSRDRRTRANRPAKRWRHAELPSNWVAMSSGIARMRSI